MNENMIFNLGGSGGGAVTGFKESAEYPGCYYRTVDGVTEWLNPPMVLGTEYRTIERFKGNVVYAKAVNFGTLPDTTRKEVSSGLSKSYTIVDFTFIAKGTDSDSGTYVGVYTDHGTDVSVWLGNNLTKIICSADTDFSGETGTAFLKYTK